MISESKKSETNYQDKLQELKKLESELEIREGLPHLFGWKKYIWQKDFYNSINRDNFLCAANQVGKSTIQICKAIHWATEPSIWPDLWQSKPTQFWYFYPSLKLATREFKEKWIKEILPRGKFKEHHKYGWKVDYWQKYIHSLTFNTGVTIYFLSYAQDEQDMQAATVYAMFTDEELPEHLLSELQARLRSVRGYYHQVFTATLGQELWRATIEEKGKNEKFPNAFKRQVSLYDCQEYEDGSKSQWTDERISEEIDRCSTQKEVQRRIFGRFIVEGGLKYEAFSVKDNVKAPHEINSTWHTYAAVDVGSGGESAHPAAIIFVKVNPDFTQGRVIKCWRGDRIVTTSSDIVSQFKMMKGDMRLSGQYYDWGSKDFQVVATRKGEPFLPAEKGHGIGEGIVNTLFKHKALIVYDTGSEARKLITELSQLRADTLKRNAKDDLCDALRYCVTGIPWDFEKIGEKNMQIKEKKPVFLDERELFRQRQLRGEKIQEQDLMDQVDLIAEEIMEANDFYDTNNGGELVWE